MFICEDQLDRVGILMTHLGNPRFSVARDF